MVQATAAVGTRATVIHASYTGGRLHLWCERPFGPGSGPAGTHPGAARPDWIGGEEGEIRLRLPGVDGAVLPSATLALEMGSDRPSGDGLVEVAVPTVSVGPGEAGAVLESLAERAEAESESAGGAGLVLGAGTVYFDAAARLARHLLAGQRFVPMMLQDEDGVLTASWWPWLSDEGTARRVGLLVGSMPGVARAAVDEHAHDGWSVTMAFLSGVTDELCRRTLIGESMDDTIEDTDPRADPQVAWLHGLLSTGVEVPAPG